MSNVTTNALAALIVALFQNLLFFWNGVRLVQKFLIGYANNKIGYCDIFYFLLQVTNRNPIIFVFKRFFYFF